MPNFWVKDAVSGGVDGLACEDGMHAFRNGLNPGTVRPKTFGTLVTMSPEYRQIPDSTCA